MVIQAQGCWLEWKLKVEGRRAKRKLLQGREESQELPIDHHLIRAVTRYLERKLNCAFAQVFVIQKSGVKAWQILEQVLGSFRSINKLRRVSYVHMNGLPGKLSVELSEALTTPGCGQAIIARKIGKDVVEDLRWYVFNSRCFAKINGAKSFIDILHD